MNTEFRNLFTFRHWKLEKVESEDPSAPTVPLFFDLKRLAAQAA